MDQYNFTWIEPDIADENLFEVDELLAPYFGFFRNLEIHCVAGCCGIDAFSFAPADIESASKDFDKKTLTEGMEHVIQELKNRTEKTVVSSRLNNLFDKSTFINLLEHTTAILRREN